MIQPTEDINIIRSPKGIGNAYFLMSRATAQDSNLSFEAIGALAYLLSKPDEWIVRNKDLEQFGTPSMVKRVIKELTKHGYLSKPERIKDPKTKKFTGWTPRKVFETTQKTVSAKTEPTGNRTFGKPKVRENDRIDNTDVLNNTEVKETTLQDAPADAETSKEYDNADLLLALETVYKAHGGYGTPPNTIDEFSGLMPEDDRLDEVYSCAKQQYKARTAPLKPLQPESPRDQLADELVHGMPLADYTAKLAADEQARQSKITENETMKKLKASAKLKITDNAKALADAIPDLLGLNNGRNWNIAHMLTGTSKKTGYKEYAQYFTGDNMVTPSELSAMVTYYKKECPETSIPQSPEVIADWIGKYRNQQKSTSQQQSTTAAVLNQITAHNTTPAPPPSDDMRVSV